MPPTIEVLAYLIERKIDIPKATRAALETEPLGAMPIGYGIVLYSLTYGEHSTVHILQSRCHAGCDLLGQGCLARDSNVRFEKLLKNKHEKCLKLARNIVR